MSLLLRRDYAAEVVCKPTSNGIKIQKRTRFEIVIIENPDLINVFLPFKPTSENGK